MLATKYTVKGLTRKMISKYGLDEAIFRLRWEYGYTVERIGKIYVFTDMNPVSRFYEEKYAVKVKKDNK